MTVRTRTRTRTVTVDLDASAQHCRNHYAKRRKAGDRQVTVWMTPVGYQALQEIKMARAMDDSESAKQTVEAIIEDALLELRG